LPQEGGVGIYKTLNNIYINYVKKIAMIALVHIPGQLIQQQIGKCEIT
jgi:hypothetical protein